MEDSDNHEALCCPSGRRKGQGGDVSGAPRRTRDGEKVANGASEVGSFLLFWQAAVYALCLLMLTGLIPEWGRWYSRDPVHREQAAALLGGRLALSESPADLRHDWAWSEGGAQQVWGLGVPLWRAGFDLVAQLFGRRSFPDRIVFGAALFVIGCVVMRVFMWNGHPGATHAHLKGIGSVVLLLGFPPFITLLQTRFSVREEVCAYSYLFAVLLFVLLIEMHRRFSFARFLMICSLAGFAPMVRPTLIFYGCATAGIAGALALRNRQRLRRVIAGMICFAAGLGLLLATNQLRFGSALEFGHRLNLQNDLSGSMYATRFDDPFQEEPVMSAAQELFGAVFLVHSLTGFDWYAREIFFGQSATVRWREFYIKLYDPSYLAAYLVGFLLLVDRWRKTFRRGWRIEWGCAEMAILWAALSFSALFIFYLRVPVIASRYTIDFAPALAAGMAGVWWLVMESRWCARNIQSGGSNRYANEPKVDRSAAELKKHFPVAALPLGSKIPAAGIAFVILMAWISWQIVAGTSIYGPPTAITAVQAETRQRRPPLVSPLPASYCLGDDLEGFGIPFNGIFWDSDSGWVKPLVAFFVEDPQWLELTVSPRAPEVCPISVPIRAKIGLEHLELKGVRTDGDEWKIRFGGPQRRRYQEGLQVVFLAMDRKERLAEDSAVWMLREISWKPEEERKRYVNRE
jgi:hypothetical protein